MAKAKEKSPSLIGRLSNLECHFKWQPEKGGSKKGLGSMCQYLIEDVQDNPAITLQAFTLISYLNSLELEGRFCDLKTALNYAEIALQEAENYDAIVKIPTFDPGFVAKANKAHILFKLGRREDSRKIVDDLEQAWKKRSNMTEAFVLGIHAFALSRYGPKAIDAAEDCFTRAHLLDPDYPDDHFGIAMIKGRKRRLTDRYSAPSEIELEHYQNAVRLSNESNAVFMIFYVRNLQQANYWDEAQIVLSKVLQFGWNNLRVLRMCSDFFRGQRNYQKQKECLEHALEISNEGDHMTLHKAGMFFWQCRKYQNLDKARKYLQMSVSKAPGEQYFYADLNWIHFKEEHIQDYDPLADLATMEQKYQYALDLATINMERGLYFDKKKEYDTAIENFKEAVTLDPECDRVEKAKKFLINHVQRLCDKDESQAEGYLLDAWLSYTFQPPNLEKAAESFKQVLAIDSQCPEAILGLCKVNMKVGKEEESLDILKKVEDEEIKGIPLLESSLSLAKRLAVSQASRAFELYQNCIEKGCKDACKPVVCLLSSNQGLSDTKAYYEQLAKVYLCWKNEDGIHLYPEVETVTTDGQLEELVYRALGIGIESDAKEATSEEKLSSLRRQRWLMSFHWHKNAGSGDTKDFINNVLCISRFNLDRTLKQFRNKHFPKSKKETIYPFKCEPQNLKKQLEKDMQLNNFHVKFAKLFDFLLNINCVKNPKDYGWVPTWCKKVNIYKHEEELRVEDYTIEDTSVTVHVYDLAHSAADYAEMVVKEFNKYM